MRQLMDFMDSAYFCATKDPVSGHAPDAARSFGQYGVLPQEGFLPIEWVISHGFRSARA